MARWKTVAEPSRRGVLAGALALGASALSPTARAQTAAVPAGAATPLEIAAARIATFGKLSSETQFGRLTFRGGLTLTSSNADFGGLSGLVVEPDGRGFATITDQSHWITGDLTYAGSAPSGIVSVRMGPILALSGREISRKRDGDAEAMALLDGNLQRGTLLIAFERNHRIGRFPILDRIVQAPTGYLKLPPEARRMRSNSGLEAVTVMTGGPHKGAVVAFSEKFPTADGHHVGWLWIGGEARRFGLDDIGDFELTDCASLPDGSLLVLERRFRWSEGVKMRLRLLGPAEVAPGVQAKGTVLLAADMTAQIDNMEGLAVHRDTAGATILTLASDDNFSRYLQRTILLQFALGNG
jgi:hypothetical protein